MRVPSQTGATLLELLFVVSLLSLLLALVIPRLRPPQARRAATELRAFIVEARLEAIARGEPAAVVFDAAREEFQTRSGSAATFAELCRRGPVARRLPLHDYALRGDRSSWLPRGLVWLPSGLARSCSGGGVTNQTLRFLDRRSSVRLLISRAGRLRLAAP